MTADWNAKQYLKFEDDRTRPSRDLLAQVPVVAPKRVVDLGCGPGNSTELLIERFPEADVIGMDSSPDMLRQARERLPGKEFVQGDITQWQPPSGTDVLFANAVMQWVPDHLAVLERLLRGLPSGGALAVQMPDNTQEQTHVLMREVALRGAWRDKLAAPAAAREDLPAPEVYYDQLRPLCARFDVWHIHYEHVLDNAAAIGEWFKSTALRPYLNALDGTARDEFYAAYLEAVAKAYPPRFDSKVMVRFPRLFIVGVR